MINSGYAEPMVDRQANSMELINEAFVLMLTYHLYQFTDYNSDLEIRSYVGYSLMALLILNVALNLGLVTVQVASIALRKLKLFILKWIQYFKIEEINEKAKEKRDRLAT